MLLPVLGLVAASCAAALGLAAQASGLSGVSAAFGNTVVTTYPDGRNQRIWLHEDGSWEGVNRRGASIAGRWELRAEKICLRQIKPINLPITYCTDFPSDSVPGAQWTGRDMTGRPIQLTLQRGVQKP
jgi:hypothetical protein